MRITFRYGINKNEVVDFIRLIRLIIAIKFVIAYNYYLSENLFQFFSKKSFLLQI